MVMRLTGMSSGLDIDKIIGDLMKVERMPQQKLIQKQTLLSYESELYREINTKMSALRESLNTIRYSSNMTGLKASSSSTEVLVNASSITGTGTKTINVTQLAEAAVVNGTEDITRLGLKGSVVSSPVEVIAGDNDKLVVTLDNMAKMVTLAPGVYNDANELAGALQNGINNAFGSNKITVSTDAGSIKLDPVEKSGYMPQVVVNDSNGALTALGFNENQMYRLNMNTKLSDLSSNNKFNKALQIDPVQNDFKINGVTISFTGDDTLQSIMNKVNSSSAGVTMSYNVNTDQFQFKSRLTGLSSEVNLEATGNGNFLQVITNASGSLPSDSLIGNVDTGLDAQFTYNGVAYSEASNSFNKDGIGFKLNQATGTDITITLAADPDTIVDKVKGFITAYNDMIDLVNKRLSEDKSRGYLPLSSEEKQEMKDSDIALWDAEVKKGLLGNSIVLKNVKSSLRELFSKTVDGLPEEFNTLSAIGISTVPYMRGFPQDAGKIKVDEAKLREAIAADPESVNKLLTNNPGFESQEGIMVSMYNRVDSLIGGLIDKAGRVGASNSDSTAEIGRRVSQLEFKIKAMDSMLSKKEDSYYKRFSAMETAIANSNATMSWLSQQLG
ncbi:flagellar filament capping protein FliD [Paenibacillus sp. GCM10023252]|uniref:flagellar filament capping protein FliD n=1 Tax=Paenibacillus sp. GCM10023252 TaxID=3252649 RepID=UPI003620AA71